jgi:hypothetical protein
VDNSDLKLNKFNRKKYGEKEKKGVQEGESYVNTKKAKAEKEN